MLLEKYIGQGFGKNRKVYHVHTSLNNRLIIPKMSGGNVVVLAQGMSIPFLKKFIMCVRTPPRPMAFSGFTSVPLKLRGGGWAQTVR